MIRAAFGMRMILVQKAFPRRDAGTRSLAISRTINAERLVLLAWSRAVLLQFAHPLIAAGVYEHSSFGASPWAAARRLKHTVRAMLALTFGSEAERALTLEGIRAIHRRVRGKLRADVGPFRAGTPYSAEDPALVLWVHATLLESVSIFYELIRFPLSAAERDAYCVEAAPVALALGARPSDIPRSQAALHEYINRMYASGEIAVGKQARELAAQILTPPFGLLGAPAAVINRVLTLGLLPTFIRRQYGFEWTLRDERALALVVPALCALRKALPDALVTWRAARCR
jgi:uncharacterized protein (DUF2236 family)